MVCLIANRVIASLQCTLRETVPSHHDSQRAVLGKDPPFATGWLLRECWHCSMGKLWHWFCNSFSNHESFLYLIIFLRVIVTVILESH